MKTRKTKSFLAVILAFVLIVQPMIVFAGNDYRKVFPKKYQTTNNAIVTDKCVSLRDVPAGNYKFLNQYVPQGVTKYNDYILVSGYDKRDGGKPQIIEIFSSGNSKHIGTITLDINSHMGGIEYANGYIWIASTKRLCSFPVSKVDDAINTGKSTVSDKDVKSSVKNPKSEKIHSISAWIRGVEEDENSEYNVSFCKFFKGYLWIGSYTTINQAKLRKIKLNSDGTAKETGVEIEIPHYVQGASFATVGDTDYLVLTGRGRKMGLFKAYFISSYKFNENMKTVSPNDYEKRLETPSYIEEGMVDTDNNLYYQVFESGSEKYKNEKNTVYIEDVLAIDLSAILPIDSNVAPLSPSKPKTTSNEPDEPEVPEGELDSAFAEKLCSDTWSEFAGSYKSNATHYSITEYNFSEDGTAQRIIGSYHSYEGEDDSADYSVVDSNCIEFSIGEETFRVYQMDSDDILRIEIEDGKYKYAGLLISQTAEGRYERDFSMDFLESTSWKTNVLYEKLTYGSVGFYQDSSEDRDFLHAEIVFGTGPGDDGIIDYTVIDRTDSIAEMIDEESYEEDIRIFVEDSGDENLLNAYIFIDGEYSFDQWQRNYD